MDELLQSVIEAATWIEKVNPWFEDDFYRSEELRPTGYLLACRGYNASCLRSLVLKRRRLLQDRNVPPLSLDELLTKGKLVLASPTQSVRDGAPAVESLGYFDDSEVAPWDTWVALASVLPPFPERNEYLISWVPAHMLDWVQGGIDVSCLDNIKWLDSLAPNLPEHPALQVLFTGLCGLPDSEFASYDAEMQERLAFINNQKWIIEPR